MARRRGCDVVAGMPFPCRRTRTAGLRCATAAGAPPRILASLAGCALALLAAPAVRAADIDVALSTHYSTGDYGEDDSIDVVYAPAVVRMETGAWQFKAIVPFLRISGGSTTIELPTGPVTTENGTNEGLGDIVVEGSYAVAPLLDWAPWVDIIARMKLPTASEDDGLGTGEVDFSPEIELLRRYGRWTPFASLGFRVLGDTSDATYRDGFLASAGLLCRVLDWLEPGVFVYWRQAATGGSPDSLELLPMLRLQWDDRWTVDAYASAGFTDSSPDAGVGLEIRYRIFDVFD